MSADNNVNAGKDTVDGATDPMKKPQATVDDTYRQRIINGICRPESDRRGYFGSMNPILRKKLFEKICLQSNQGNMNPIDFFSMVNPNANHDIYVSYEGDMMSSNGKKKLGECTVHVLFHTTHNPPLVLELTWKKGNKHSNSKYTNQQSNNAGGELTIINLWTNEPLCRIIFPPVYDCERLGPEKFFPDSEHSYNFFASGVAQSLHDSDTSLPENSFQGATLDIPKIYFQQDYIDTPVCSETIEGAKRARALSAISVNGFRKAWETMPWEEDLRRLASSPDLQKLIAGKDNPEMLLLFRQYWKIDSDPSVSAFSAGFRGASR